MGLTELLKSVSEKDDRTSADVLAAFVNADCFARQQLANRSAFDGADILRLGRVLNEYADINRPTDVFRKQQPSVGQPARPLAPGPAVAEQAA
ncbi:hypothetical protein [Bosea sp. Root670]|uniref:hypothetical protein n=1 Tax=Bosea sp. Root670 TaxID=1736583 RepID=UPI0012E381B1|nr:hypothetical protein [Bosea sp. Root670]